MLQRMLTYIRRHGLARPGDRVGVAVSGGADSVALLRLLLEARAELGLVLAVVHFNHQIRGAEADADEQFVRKLAAQFDLEFFSNSADTPAYAAEHKLSLEAAAREFRYQFFWKLVSDGAIHRIATAHTRDDQAETVLQRFLRGAGTRGLAAIYPELRLEKMYSPQQIERRELPVGDSPWIIRPLLETSRAELRHYLHGIGQAWREDASNQDVSFTRNRLRHEIMPVLRELNPNLDQVLSETAEIARAEEQWWEHTVSQAQASVFAWQPKPTPDSPPVPRINLERFRAEPLAVQRRLLRRLGLVCGSLEFQHVQQLLELTADPSQAVRRVELPHDYDAIRAGQELWIERRCPSEQAGGYDLALPVPGRLEVPEAGMVISAVPATTGERVDPAVGGGLRVRNWRPGDRYWPAHTAAPKKLKELLLARHIPRQHKARWPVVVRDDQIVWVPGFPLPEQFRLRDEGTEGVRLEQLPMQPREGNGP